MITVSFQVAFLFGVHQILATRVVKMSKTSHCFRVWRMVACEENGAVHLQVVTDKKVHQSVVFVLGYHHIVLCCGIQLPIELNGVSLSTKEDSMISDNLRVHFWHFVKN